MRNLRTFCVAGIAVAAGLLGGCGGDDEPSIEEIVSQISSTTTTTSTTETIDKSEVIATGDAICSEANAAINSVAAEADRALAADQVGSITSGMRRDIRALEAPDEDSDDLSALIQAFGDQVTALEQRAATARSGDEAGYQAAGVDLDAARQAALTAGEAYGFKNCGQPFDSVPVDPAGGDSGGVSPDTPTAEPPVTTTTPVVPPDAGGGTGAPDGGTGGDTGDGDTGGGSSGSSGGISPG